MFSPPKLRHRFLNSLWPIGLVAVLTSVQLACQDAKEHANAAKSPALETSIHVSAVPLKADTMQQEWTVYGTMSALPSTIHRYSLPFEVRLTSFAVSEGQHVEAGAPLFVTERSPQTALLAKETSDLFKEAGDRLEQTKNRQGDGFATREELLQAQGRFRRAQQAVTTMRRSGQLSTTQTSRAQLAGVVSKIESQPGSQVSAGLPIVSIAEDESIGASFWIEPAKAHKIHHGMPVSITGVDSQAAGRGPASGKVLRVDRQVDSNTNFVRVSVVLTDSSSLVLGETIVGTIALGPADGFIVPRSALVSSGGESRIFTIENGHARVQDVTVVDESELDLLVRGPTLSEGQQVITIGAYQSEDGMRVIIDP